ncbi:MAG: putative 2OG-Fe(II) oxygenase [Pseudomonadota bacterium]
MSDAHAQARSLRAAGQTQAAIKVYRTHLARLPSDRIAWHNLASALGDAGHHGDAVVACGKAFSLGLDAAETWLILARSSQAMGRFEEAEHAYEEALKRKGDDIPTLRDHAQLLWMRTGNADKALSRFATASKLHPNNLGVQLALSRVMGQMGLKDEGFALALEIAKRAPAAPAIQVATANAANLSGDHVQALKFARAARAIDTHDKSAGLAEVQALLALGEPLKANVIIEQQCQLHPQDQYVRAMQAIIWRLLGDARYDKLYDYHRLVRAYELIAPKGWRSVEQYVDEVREALLERHQFHAHPFDQSVKGAGSQITHIERMADSPALSAWTEATLPSLRDYCLCDERTSHLVEEDDQTLVNRYKTWSIRLKRSGRHTDHVHPDGIISSACHILAPEPLNQGPHGWLRFGKPGVLTKPVLEAEYHHRPDEGVIVFFPSYIWHGVTPFEGDGTRLTIAMDIAQN